MVTVGERLLPEEKVAPHEVEAASAPVVLPETMRAVVLTGPHKHEIRDDVPCPTRARWRS